MANNRAMAIASQLRPTTTRLASALQRYFEMALYLLVFTGFGTLVATGGLSIATALVVTVALLLRGFTDDHRRSEFNALWACSADTCPIGSDIFSHLAAAIVSCSIESRFPVPHTLRTGSRGHL